MEGVESKAESQGKDSQNMSENVEGFQQCVKEIHNLIEQDEDFSKMTAEIYDCKKSKLSKLVTELSRMYGALVDQHIHSIKEVSKNDSSKSTSPQATQKCKTPVKKDASKVKETKARDPEVLLKKISSLEKEGVNLKKTIQNLTDENALLEAEKANVAELKLMIIESNRKVETMRNAFEGSRKQLLAADQKNGELQRELASKVFDLTHQLREHGLIDRLGPIGERIDSLEKKFDEEQYRNPKLHEKLSLAYAEIAKRDEQITELNTQIDLLKNSRMAKEDKWNADIERLKTQLWEQCELVYDLNQKHDALMSHTNELRKSWNLKEGEVMSEDAA
ncbi:hypothetical protein L1887_08856 [Cichorium endivia]|nr:hypothetical protein L1887_08856 [Cichorium endivia]